MDYYTSCSNETAMPFLQKQIHKISDPEIPHQTKNKNYTWKVHQCLNCYCKVKVKTYDQRWSFCELPQLTINTKMKGYQEWLQLKPN